MHEVIGDEIRLHLLLGYHVVTAKKDKKQLTFNTTFYVIVIKIKRHVMKEAVRNILKEI